jgi:integrase
LDVHLSRRGGVYQFRLRVPQDLAARLEIAELRFSLRTRNPQLAKRLGNAGRSAMAKLFDHLRMRTDTDQRPWLTPDEMRRMAQDFFRREVMMDEYLRANAAGHRDFFDHRRESRPAEEQELRGLIGSGGAKEARDQAIDALYKNEMITDEGRPRIRYTDDQLNALSFYLLRARLAANLLAQAHDRGDFAATPGDPLFKDLLDPVLDLKGPLMAEAMKMIPPASSPSVPAKFTERQRTLIGAVKDQMISEEKSKNSKKGKDDYDNAINWLVQVIGNKSIGLVTAEDLLKFKETLLQAPVRFSLDLKTDNILEAIKLNGRREPRLKLQRMSLKTVNKYLSPVRQVFEYAARNRFTVGGANPSIGLTVKIDKRLKRSRVRGPFEVAQLQRMFETPLYCGCRSEHYVFEVGLTKVRDHRFWAPLISLFGGCRLNEIGQLEVGDVKTFNRRPHFYVRTERDPEDEDDLPDEQEPLDEEVDERDRQLKGDASQRRVPVHSELIRIGILNYVLERRLAIAAELKANGTNVVTRLFPDWEMGAEGYYSSVLSKWFNARFLPKSKLKNKKLCFHSLRHNFADALRDSVRDETRHRMMGHASNHVSGDYGTGVITKTQSSEIDLVAYDGLELSHLHVAKPIETVEELNAEFARRTEHVLHLAKPL